MLISIFSTNDDAQSFLTLGKKIQSQCHCIRAPIVLGYDDAQSFEKPRIKNKSVTAPSAHILLGDDDAQ